MSIIVSELSAIRDYKSQMLLRLIVVIIFSSLLSFSYPALAQGNGGGNGNSSENGSGNGSGGENSGRNENSGGNGGGSGNGNSGGGNGAGNGNSGGNGGGNGNSAGGNSGSSGGNSGSNGGGNTGGNDESSARPTGGSGGLSNSSGLPRSALPLTNPASRSEETALGAVQAGQAVPLTTILNDLKVCGAGELIDAQLVTAGNFLLYAVKTLSADGRVATEYYYARTGRLVEVQ